MSVTKDQLKASADSLPGIRLIDPARMSQAFEQLQQVRGYYSVAPVLDVDRYPIPGADGKPVERDLVLGVRELDQSGLVSDQRNWANEHTVYTHGYGVVAAYGNTLDADEEARRRRTSRRGRRRTCRRAASSPTSPARTATRRGSTSVRRARRTPSSASPRPARDVELDIPEEASGERGTTTYDGADGVAVGGFFNKLLYAIKFGEPNIMLSSRVNENSKILYERQPA